MSLLKEGESEENFFYIDDELIHEFLEMSNNADNKTNSDNEIVIQCAYNFPAVLYALGKDKWSLLHESYYRLATILIGK